MSTRTTSRAGKARKKRSGTRPERDEASEISIGALAKELGLSTATINFYVAEGVLPPPRKLNRTRAAYSPKHVRILRIVKRMQSVGYTLAQIRALFDRVGADEAGLKKMEGIGSLQPLPPPRNDPDQKPIERFSPVDRAAFLAMLPSGTSTALVDELERIGLLRAPGGKYDAAELWLVRNVAGLIKDGATLAEVLALAAPFAAVAQRVAPLVARTLLDKREAVLSRDVRFRDVVQPYLDVTGYLLHREIETTPGWRDLFRFDGADR